MAGSAPQFTHRRIVVDTETTGLSPIRDEILTLSIVDGEGNVLWDRLYRPARVVEWPGAAKVNGIWPDDVASCPCINADVDAINDIFQDAEEVCIYNAKFDLAFLSEVGIRMVSGQRVCDVMLAYADAVCGGRWAKLTKAAARIGYDWGPNQAHSSVGDCLATLAVLKWLEDENFR